jgi:hypothetical protein
MLAVMGEGRKLEGLRDDLISRVGFAAGNFVCAGPTD